MLIRDQCAEAMEKGISYQDLAKSKGLNLKTVKSYYSAIKIEKISSERSKKLAAMKAAKEINQKKIL